MDIRIEGDPTSWTLAHPQDVSRLAASGEPEALAVSEPLAGRLLLSLRSVGSVVFFQPAMDPHHGVVPNGVRLPEQCLYVPSTTGPDPHSNPARYYLLPTSTDLAALETEIKAAMREGIRVSIDFTGPDQPGVLVLNGGALSFVVLCAGTPRS
jgi:hypothetical protein